jgi:subtilisin family serine protease
MPTNKKLYFLRILAATLGFQAFVCLTFSIGLAEEPLIPVDGGAKTLIAAPGLIKGEVLIRFIKGAVAPPSLERGQGRLGVARKTFAALSRRRQQTYQHVTSDNYSTAELLEIYRADPQVEAISPNYARSPHRLPDDPFFNHLWGLYNSGQSVLGVKGITGADIDAALAWNISSGDDEVVVAVIDSGVDYDHEDLFPNMWQNPGEVPGNDEDDDGNGYADDIYGYDFASDNFGNNDSDPMDIETHGSHVAGTAAAYGNNGLGITGVSWNSKIMALKAMRPDGLFYDSDIMEAIDYAIAMKERGVNVVAVNASYGGDEGNQSDPMRDAIAEAGQAGIIFVASAGNDRSDNDQIPKYPASYDAPNIISVAASDNFDDLSNFSNYGSASVHLAAPGEGIFSTVPEQKASVYSGGTQYMAVAFEYAGYTSGTTGNIFSCGKGYPPQFPPDVAGNIALIERGSDDENPFYFSTKVQNAMNAGAKAVIIYNNKPGLDNVTLGSAGDWVPAVFISQTDGQFLPSLGTPLATVFNGIASGYQYKDGTSMAAPHVTGAIAVLAAAFPTESVSLRISRILGGAERLESLSGRVSTGGRLNLYNALRLYRSVNMAPIYELLLFE